MSQIVWLFTGWTVRGSMDLPANHIQRATTAREDTYLLERLFCGQPGERLPDIAGEVESPQRAHRAVAAQLHRAGDARRDVRRCLSLSASDADVFCQRLSGHGAGRVGRDRDEPLCQRCMAKERNEKGIAKKATL